MTDSSAVSSAEILGTEYGVSLMSTRDWSFGVSSIEGNIGSWNGEDETGEGFMCLELSILGSSRIPLGNKSHFSGFVDQIWFLGNALGF